MNREQEKRGSSKSKFALEHPVEMLPDTSLAEFSLEYYVFFEYQVKARPAKCVILNA